MGMIEYLKGKKNGNLLGYEKVNLSDVTIGSAILNVTADGEGEYLYTNQKCERDITTENCERMGKMLSTYEKKPLVRGFITNKDGTAVKDVLTGEILRVSNFTFPTNFENLDVQENETISVYYDGNGGIYLPVGNPRYTDDLSDMVPTISSPTGKVKYTKSEHEIPVKRLAVPDFSIETDRALTYGLVASTFYTCFYTRNIFYIRDIEGLIVPDEMASSNIAYAQNIRTLIERMNSSARIGYKQRKAVIDDKIEKVRKANIASTGHILDDDAKDFDING